MMLILKKHRKSIIIFLLSFFVSSCAIFGIRKSYADDYKKITIKWYPVQEATLISSRTNQGQTYQGNDAFKLAELAGLSPLTKTLWIPKSIDYKIETKTGDLTTGKMDGETYCYSDLDAVKADFEKYKIIGQAYTAKDDGSKSDYKAKWSGNSLVADTATNDGRENTSGRKTANVTWDDIQKNPENYPVAWMAYKMFDVKVINPFDSSKEINFFDIGSSAKSMLEYNKVKDLKYGDKTITDVAKSINKQMGEIAVYLLFCFFILAIFRESLKDSYRFTPPMLIMKIVKYLVIMQLAFNSWPLCSWIMETCDAFVGTVSKAVGSAVSTSVTSMSVGKSVAVMLANMTLIDKVISFIMVVILWIMVLSTATAVLVFVLTRVFRILIMLAFAPISMSLFADEKTVQKAKQFIVDLFSLGLECSVIVILAAFYGVMLNNSLPGSQPTAFGIIDMVKYMLDVIVCNAVFAATIHQSMRLSRGIIGGR